MIPELGRPEPRAGDARCDGGGRSAALHVAGPALLLAGCCMLSSPRHPGPASDHFDGASFHNQRQVEQPGVSELVKWRLDRAQGPWRTWVDAEPGPPPPAEVPRGALRVTLIGHATLLVQMDGRNVLTDPIYSDRASPVGFAGPHRVRPPGIRFEDLPTIHGVVVSHDHYDHLDLPTLRRLHDTHHPRYFVGLGVAALLAAEGIDDVVELDWWQHAPLDDNVTVHFVPAQHFSQRGACDRNATLWGGHVLTGPAGVVYFAGDTAFGPHFAQIRARFGPPRLALLPIGAYLPRWFMESVHVSPEQAVETHRVLGAAHSVAMHYGTFPLGDDGEEQPVADLRAAMRQQAVVDDRFWVLGFGEGRDVPPPASDRRSQNSGKPPEPAPKPPPEPGPGPELEPPPEPGPGVVIHEVGSSKHSTRGRQTVRL